MTNQRQYRRTLKEWLIVLASLIDDVAVTAVLLLVLRLLNIPVALPVIIFLVVFFVAFAFLMHRAIIPSLRRKKVTGREGMVGLEGKVVEPLMPLGLVQVKGEYWQAKSVGGSIEVGEMVVVLGVEGLVLEVRRKDVASV